LFLHQLGSSLLGASLLVDITANKTKKILATNDAKKNERSLIFQEFSYKR
jgi:hypothetical protein